MDQYLVSPQGDRTVMKLEKYALPCTGSSTSRINTLRRMSGTKTAARAHTHYLRTAAANDRKDTKQNPVTKPND
jgi:hypothetical protein